MGKTIRRKLRYFAIGFTNAFDMSGRRIDSNLELDTKPFGYYSSRNKTSEAKKKLTEKTRKSLASSNA